MADTISPPQDKQSPQQMQQRYEQAAQMVEILGKQVQQLLDERDAKILELQNQKEIAEIKADVDRMKIEKDFALGSAKIESVELITSFKEDMAFLKSKIEALSSLNTNGSGAQQPTAETVGAPI
jgi:hypothetical protein